jgi:hypothetical protein
MSKQGRQGFCEEVDNLAAGTLSPEVPDYIQKRMAHAATTREDQKNHFNGRGRLKDPLCNVPESALPAWLHTKTLTSSGAVTLSDRLEVLSNGSRPLTIGRLVSYNRQHQSQARVWCALTCTTTGELRIVVPIRQI